MHFMQKDKHWQNGEVARRLFMRLYLREDEWNDKDASKPVARLF